MRCFKKYYPHKPKKRSYDDQKFDNLLYGIPFDDEINPNKKSKVFSSTLLEHPEYISFKENLLQESISEQTREDNQSRGSLEFEIDFEEVEEVNLRSTLKENIQPKEPITLSPASNTFNQKSLTSERQPFGALGYTQKPDFEYWYGFEETDMADYQDEQGYHHVTNGDSLPDCNVATLSNMGNTCFLNSVLYTLRFAPTVLHNLHHLLVDLSMVNSKLKESRTKTSSLGRNGSAVSGSSWRSASSKDLLSIGNNDLIPKSKEQIVTEKLHAVFVTMNNIETKSSSEPYQPEELLQAVRDANSMFIGNHQQDAHEFLVELSRCLRVTCDKLNEQIEQYPELIKSPEATSAPTVPNNNSKWSMRRSWKKPLKKKEKSSKKNGDIENDILPNDCDKNTGDANDENLRKKCGYNFITEDFEGVSLHRTKCLECEEVSERKEPFLDIQVAVNYRDEDFDTYIKDSSIFGAICCTSEKLSDQNKYFCENCNRYNEAQRTVLYEKLPNIMVLHLKRFTTSLSGVQKVNTFVPTPLEIRCFCEGCSKMDSTKITPHRYRLSCVIMHLGASMASGHYIAYSRASVETYDYVECTRDIPKNYLSSSNKEVTLLKFFKTKALGNSLSETQNGIGTNSKKNDAQLCQSMSCCGIRCKLNLELNSCEDWLEFDDEKVKHLSNKEFTDMLNRRHDNTNTPYLLFYSKI
ncbi:ubiquitin carboxyl-terminal hydrolase 1 [Anthonomus grandis grandis]|uniref:ubiquitin carboxyl-terminal hydrolase 1 n=1 Tax=Anthonomus grandis grandis TaxID=2921223 RepID=UPI0021650621|nr:ubiquitin carboxyl-terminal hydrolase 1 [Anthonomus grandis grandis]XP_050303202.1 ubiquitin carboxyl-terminal hydrolase 1 [Anthonomus grandis grandis]XP_050303203.1 ubiquitin carboxyl-terminal hydrolase 1 [Anthonomus grandis grandis]